jgi:hypothetical protein
VSRKQKIKKKSLKLRKPSLRMAKLVPKKVINVTTVNNQVTLLVIALRSPQKRKRIPKRRNKEQNL